MSENERANSRRWIFDDQTPLDDSDLGLTEEDFNMLDASLIAEDNTTKAKRSEGEMQMSDREGLKDPPKVKTNRLSKFGLDNQLVLYLSPKLANDRVIVKLDKEAPEAVFAAKEIEFNDQQKRIQVFNTDVGTLGLILGFIHHEKQFYLHAVNPNIEDILRRNIEANADTVYNTEVIRPDQMDKVDIQASVYVPQSHVGLALIRQQIVDIKRRLPIGGELILISHKKSGGIRHKKLLVEVFGVDSLIAEKLGMGGYLLAKVAKQDEVIPEVTVEKQKIEFMVLGRKFKVETIPALFSKSGLDEGTRLLLESTEEKIRRAKKILDLGCGWGAIGLVVASVNLEAEVTMVDVDQRAIDLVKRNVELVGLDDRLQTFLTGDVSLFDKEYDLVLSNPPFHEKESALIELFTATRKMIVKGGEICIVVEDTYKGKFENIMRKVFGNVNEYAAFEEGYSILLSRK